MSVLHLLLQTNLVPIPTVKTPQVSRIGVARFGVVRQALVLSLASGLCHRFLFYMDSGVRVWVYIPLHAARVVVLREECLVVSLPCNFFQSRFLPYWVGDTDT